jgi:uncharacterized repeat protein (TIGR04002 family)
MRRDQHGKVKILVLTAMFAAVIFVFTAYIFHIPFLTGYLHFGDTFIFLAASMLPTPYAIGASVIGAGLSDLLTFPIWVGPTILIKGMMALVFSAKKEKMVCGRNLAALAAAYLINVGGYYLATGLLFQDWMFPMVRLVTDVIPPLVSSLLYILIGTALDRLGVKAQLGLCSREVKAR